MIALIQRVTQASVTVQGTVIASIGRGILALIAVQRGDFQPQADRLLERVLTYRIFPDTGGRMNLSLRDVSGELLIVPQFTLAADTRSGTRAGFTTAAPPAVGQSLFDYFVAQALRCGLKVGTGRFGADMQVALVNDGPVTFWLQATQNEPQSSNSS